MHFKVLAEYTERRLKKLCSEDDDQDDIDFWDQQKEEYLKENPSHTNLFAEEDMDDDMAWNDVNDEEIAVCSGRVTPNY